MSEIHLVLSFILGSIFLLAVGGLALFAVAHAKDHIIREQRRSEAEQRLRRAQEGHGQRAPRIADTLQCCRTLVLESSINAQAGRDPRPGAGRGRHLPPDPGPAGSFEPGPGHLATHPDLEDSRSPSAHRRWLQARRAKGLTAMVALTCFPSGAL